MKYLFTLGLTMTLCLAHAQDYQAFISNRECHYQQTIDNIDYIYSAKMDSFALDGVDTLMFNYKQVFYVEKIDDFGNACLNRDSWTGKHSIKTSDGWHKFISYNGDTSYLNTRANIGNSWHLYNFEDGNYLEAVMTDHYQDTVLNVLDSIKEFTLNLYDSNGVLQINAFNDFKILLSKNHGIIHLFSFLMGYSYPYPFDLVGMDQTGICPLKEDQLYQLEVGDYLTYSLGSSWAAKYRIITAINNTPTSVEYQYTEITKINSSYSYSSNQLMKFYFTPGKYILSGQYVAYDANYSGAFNGVIFNYRKNGVSYIKSKMQTPFTGTCWQYDIVGTRDYKCFKEAEGLSLLLTYDWAIVDHLGTSIERRDSIIYLELINRQKASGGILGKFSSVFVPQMIVPDTKVSCDGTFNFALPDLAYDSIRWHFGDGVSSTVLNPSHTYANVGSYQLSLEIYSPFQDTLIIYPDSLFYGDNETDEPITANYYMETGCNGFRFVDNTKSVDSRIWTMPDGTVSSDSSVYFTFDSIGIFIFQLENQNGMCSRSKTLSINISSIPEAPIEALCRTISSGKSLYNLTINGIEISNSSPTEPAMSATGDEFLFACNQFELNPIESNQLRMFGGKMEMLDIGGGLEIPSYYGEDYSLWIDYNNDGEFKTSEHIDNLSCKDGFDMDSESLYATTEFIVPTTAVLEKPLRMRLVLGLSYSPCDVDSTEMYDFGVIIKDISGNTELESNLFSVHPNPTQDKIHVSFGTATLVNDVNLRILNLVGETVYSDNRQSFSLNNGIDLSIDQFSTGMYVLEIEVEGRRSQQRIIKQ